MDRAFLGRGWAFPPGPGEDGRMATAAAEEDIGQAVWLILDTARGERLMREDFGSGLHKLVFEPLNSTTVALVRHHVEEALIQWEPRIDHIDVRVQAATNQGRLDIEIRYRVRSTNTFYNLVYPFYLQEGDPERGGRP